MEEGGCQGEDSDGGADEDACAKVFSEAEQGAGGGGGYASCRGGVSDALAIRM